ncbi:hypothetical protein U9M48_016104 [Paspalum notatum var. saurae]|uniref:Uncharacterized protein n=1 Tax=Paspalum notatum var. saurae TaxID=547442 RepID=A0AAQ3T4K8_PASNO
MAKGKKGQADQSPSRRPPHPEAAPHGSPSPSPSRRACSCCARVSLAGYKLPPPPRHCGRAGHGTQKPPEIARFPSVRSARPQSDQSHREEAEASKQGKGFQVTGSKKEEETMSTMAVASSSSLNPNAPLFIPAAYRQVEDFSPEWWELVKTTAWFRDHWFRQHHQLFHDDAAYAALPDDLLDDDVAALLPDDSVDLLDTDDLFYAPPEPDTHLHHSTTKAPAYDVDVLRALSLASPRAVVVGAPSPRALQQQQMRQVVVDRPAQHHVGVRGTAARRAIHQPR